MEKNSKMTTNEKLLTDYLKECNIEYHACIEGGRPMLTIVYRVDNAPGYCVESCIYFYEKEAEVGVYYSTLGAEICRKSAYRDGLFRVLNFINAKVFLACCDGCDGALYEPRMLYTPRICMTEDSYDIVITTIIPYDFWEIALLETADYLTAYCPELLDGLTYDIFGVLIGKITADEAIRSIKRDILGKDGRQRYGGLCDLRYSWRI